MSHTFSILHLSDLHERGPRENEHGRRYRVLEDAWKRNLDDLLAENAIDIVCFTGDIGDWGREDEYKQASGYFDAWLRHLGLPRERLFVVPGNHDINREVEKPVWERLRKKLPRVPALELSRWLMGGEAPLGLEVGWREAVLERQAAFRNWLKAVGRESLLPAKSRHGRLGYSVPLQLPGIPFDIQVIGLDSAWLSGDDADSGKLRLTDGQILSLCRDAEGRALAGFRLALVHHPLSDLADGGDSRRRLAESVDLLLRGHLHEAEPELWSDPDRSLRALAAGCLYEGDQADRYPNACALIRVTCDDAGRPLCYDLRLRAFSPRGGHWFDDGGLYREAPMGRLRITLSEYFNDERPRRPPVENEQKSQTADPRIAEPIIADIENLLRTPKRPELRNLLHRLFRAEPKFSGFVLDYFPEVHESFSMGMDRDTKTNILIESIDVDVVANALLKFFKVRQKS